MKNGVHCMNGTQINMISFFSVYNGQVAWNGCSPIILLLLLLFFLHFNKILVVKIGKYMWWKINENRMKRLFLIEPTRNWTKNMSPFWCTNHTWMKKKNRFIQWLLKCDYYYTIFFLFLSVSLDAVQKYAHFHKIIFVWNIFSGFSNFEYVPKWDWPKASEQNHANKYRKTNRKFSYRL